MSTDNRWMLWADLLGFKNWIDRNSDSPEAIRRLDDALRYAFEFKADFCSSFQSVLLSDTIIISTPSGTQAEFVTLATISSFLMDACLQVDLPLRGVISYGQFISRNSTNRVSVLGTAVVEAASIEPQLNFYGVVVAPSCINHWIATSDELKTEFKIDSIDVAMNHFLSLKHVPTKQGNVEMFVIPWALPTIPQRFYDLGMRMLKNPGPFTIGDLIAYNSKLKTSQFMIDTVHTEEHHRDAYKVKWQAMIQTIDDLLNECGGVA